MTLGEVLDALLAGQKISAKVKNNKIILAPAALPMQKGSLLEHYYLSGYVQERVSLEPLPFAFIKASPSGLVCQANIKGYYTMSLPAGVHKLIVLYAGYPPKTIEVTISASKQMNLAIQSDTLPAVKLSSANKLLKDGGSIASKYLSNAYTNVLGDADPVRSVYLLPGNIETQELMGKMVVRGGDPSHNLILLDGSRVYNPTHLLGEISIVNETSMKTIRQFKNDFPAYLNDALSGVTEVTTKDGNMAKWQGTASASLLAGAFTIEGPLIKNKTAIMASVRQSWRTPVIRLLEDDYKANFYDIHLKVTQLINSRHKIMLSGYAGNDLLNLKNESVLKQQHWGNRLVNISWNYALSNKVFLNTYAGISKYKTIADVDQGNAIDSITNTPQRISFTNEASITEAEAKTQMDITSIKNVRLKIGANGSSTTIQPLHTIASKEVRQLNLVENDMQPMSYKTYGLFCEQEIKPFTSFFIRPAVYLNRYFYRDYTHTSLQPRLFMSYRFLQTNQFTFSYARMNQFLHQVSRLDLGAISDFWVPSTRMLPPAQSNTINLGYKKKITKDLRLSVDVYYKTMKHITNFAEGGNVFYDVRQWEDNIRTGKGRSYGTEILLLRKAEKWSAQLAYTLSWSSRQFPDMNKGAWYPYKYDRRHVLNIAFNYQLKKWIEANCIGTFNTGDWMWLIPASTSNPNGSISTATTFVNPSSATLSYNHLNGQRTPSAYRFNCNTTIQLKASPTFSHRISAGINTLFAADNISFFSIPWMIQTNQASGNMTVKKTLNLLGYISYTLSF